MKYLFRMININHDFIMNVLKKDFHKKMVILSIIKLDFSVMNIFIIKVNISVIISKKTESFFFFIFNF